MTITQIQCFCSVVKYGSFTLAADALFMTQSAVSKQIAAFEEDCGFPLIIRKKKNGHIELTIEGQLMLRDCSKVLADYEQLVHLRNEMRKKPIANTSSFSLVCIPEMSAYGIMTAINEFEVSHPDTYVHFMESDQAQAQLSILSHEADIAFISDIALDSHQYKWLTLCAETFSILIPEGSPLAAKPHVYMKDLAGLNLIVGPKQSGLFDLCLRSCQESGFEPRFAFLSSQAANAIEYMKVHQDAVFFAPSRILHAFGELSADSRGFKVIDIENSPSFNYVMAWKSDSHLNENAKKYLQFIAAFAQGQ